MSTANSEGPSILVIGYGNEWRGDDGLGPEVARRIQSLGLTGVRTLAVHQLTPELADDLSRVRQVVFVDACRANTPDDRDGVAIEAILSNSGEMLTTHVFDPRALLALARILYERVPQAWLVTVAGVRFEPGEQLSEIASRRAEEAAGRIVALLHGDEPCKESQSARNCR